MVRLLPSVPNEHPAGTGSAGRAGLAAVAASNVLTYLGQFTLYTFISLVLLSAGVHFCGSGQEGPLFAGRLVRVGNSHGKYFDDPNRQANAASSSPVSTARWIARSRLTPMSPLAEAEATSA